MPSDFPNTLNKERFLAQMQENRFYIQEEAITEEIRKNLFELAFSSYKNQQFQEAHIGKGVNKARIAEIRSDETLWIENWQLLNRFFVGI